MKKLTLFILALAFIATCKKSSDGGPDPNTPEGYVYEAVEALKSEGYNKSAQVLQKAEMEKSMDFTKMYTFIALNDDGVTKYLLEKDIPSVEKMTTEQAKAFVAGLTLPNDYSVSKLKEKKLVGTLLMPYYSEYEKIGVLKAYKEGHSVQALFTAYESGVRMNGVSPIQGSGKALKKFRIYFTSNAPMPLTIRTFVSYAPNVTILHKHLQLPVVEDEIKDYVHSEDVKTMLLITDEVYPKLFNHFGYSDINDVDASHANGWLKVNIFADQKINLDGLDSDIMGMAYNGVTANFKPLKDPAKVEHTKVTVVDNPLTRFLKGEKVITENGWLYHINKVEIATPDN